jgi:hypothetical protein
MIRSVQSPLDPTLHDGDPNEAVSPYQNRPRGQPRIKQIFE